MYVTCLRYALSEQEAEDILQESFIKVFKNIKKFRGDSRLGYWIKRIVVNTALNHRRNKLYMYPMVDVNDVHQHLDYDHVSSNYNYEDLFNNEFDVKPRLSFFNKTIIPSYASFDSYLLFS